VKVTRLSRSIIYEQIRAGRLRTVKQGAATLITAAALDDYVKLLEREARPRQ
jgi:excisionase family DNA binding protein